MSHLIDKAVQLCEVAADWNLSEVEIDGEMVSIYDLRDEFKAALTQPSPNPTAAGGYVLAPVEPTEEMTNAGLREADPSFPVGWNVRDALAARHGMAASYRAMLASRPSIGEPVPGAGNGEVQP